MRVIEVLGKMGDAMAVKPLLETLKDENENVREAAKKALENIEAKKS